MKSIHYPALLIQVKHMVVPRREGFICMFEIEAIDMKEKLKQLISNRRLIIAIYILFALAASIQSLTTGSKTFYEGGREYNRYNNYTIFEKSFSHLKNDKDLYAAHPEEHWDLYKYTPTVAVFFGIFSILPDWLGLNLWNLLNALILLMAVYYLPKLNNYQKGLILLIVLIELMTSMQNAQSNGLIAGLLVFSFGLMEKKKPFLASLCIVFSIFIKLFGIVGLAIFLFYPKKWKLTAYSIFWALVMLSLPLIFIDFNQYAELSSSYINLLTEDHSLSYGYSVMGWLHSWFNIDVGKMVVVLAGAVIFLLPFLRINRYKEYLFKYLALCSILIWVVIFNHKAESPTFILAMTGVALWFIKSEKDIINISLFTVAFILTSLSPTDLFSQYFREEFVKPYVLKVFPCILIWLKIIYDMLKQKREHREITIN